ncbi:hypothetical protein GWI33_003234 [Rhynchophorus ferrugineus]|uniref:Uncharacterized protein n=1 Tax=Rhynchophorus ferrugineus TaxID=354439 RepID=A0A834MKW3_RHYFE|nr:hypothetical protein GWI33_003234 [Rhynchophorus ferrugineus]
MKSDGGARSIIGALKQSGPCNEQDLPSHSPLSIAVPPQWKYVRKGYRSINNGERADGLISIPPCLDVGD